MPLDFDIPMENLVVTSTGNETGICMAISAFWIQRCRLLGHLPAEDDQFFTNWREYETMGIAFETLLADYTAVTGGDALINSQTRLQQHGIVWHDQFALQLGMPIVEINWGTDDTLSFLIALMDAGPSPRGYLLTGYSTQNVDGGLQLDEGHTVAFWYGVHRKTFLDPNYGTSTVLRHAAWTLDVITHLTTHYDDFNQWVLFTI